MDFKLHSEYQPTGDQPNAIRELSDGPDFDNGSPKSEIRGGVGAGVDAAPLS